MYLKSRDRPSGIGSRRTASQAWFSKGMYFLCATSPPSGSPLFLKMAINIHRKVQQASRQRPQHQGRTPDSVVDGHLATGQNEKPNSWCMNLILLVMPS